MQETQIQSLGWKDPLEKEMATHSSILAWRIPQTEELGRLQTMEWWRVRHDWATNTHTHTHTHISQHPSIQPCLGFRKHRPLSPNSLCGQHLTQAGAFVPRPGLCYIKIKSGHITVPAIHVLHLTHSVFRRATQGDDLNLTSCDWPGPPHMVIPFSVCALQQPPPRSTSLKILLHLLTHCSQESNLKSRSQVELCDLLSFKTTLCVSNKSFTFWRG